MLRGTWEQGRGGTFVRNPHWNAASDPVRKAYPDEIRYQEGLDTQAVAQQVMADNATGRVSVSLGSAPPAIQQHITAVQSLEERSVNPLTGSSTTSCRTPAAPCSRTRRSASRSPPRRTATRT